MSWRCLFGHDWKWSKPFSREYYFVNFETNTKSPTYNKWYQQARCETCGTIKEVRVETPPPEGIWP